MMVVIASLIMIGNYDVNNLSPLIRNVQILAVIIYLIVFIQAFVQLLFRFQNAKNNDASEREKTIVFRVDRRNHPVKLDDILFVESRSDYIEIQTETDRLVTRDRISKLHERLPDEFIRVHRSFLVNSKHISSFNMEEIKVEGHVIPVGRKFRTNLDQLKEDLKV